MIGENLIYLRGYIKKPEYSIVGPYDSPMFKSLLAIPTASGYQNLRLSSFSCADGLGKLKQGTPVFIEGHIEDKSFTVRCRHCKGYEKRAWYEIVVDNFKVLEEEDLYE
jgi:hypothetical protein